MAYETPFNYLNLYHQSKILLPKKVKFESNYYSVEQLERLFEACLGTPIESAVYIAAHYGLRRGEVLGLKFDAISFHQDTLTIRETRVKYGKNTVTKKPKSASSYRTLPLIEKIKDYLEILLNQQKSTIRRSMEMSMTSQVLCVVGLMDLL